MYLMQISWHRRMAVRIHSQFSGRYGTAAKQGEGTSNQIGKVGHFFTMKDDLNIIRKFCAVR